jgi:hypothetical protein
MQEPECKVDKGNHLSISTHQPGLPAILGQDIGVLTSSPT